MKINQAITLALLLCAQELPAQKGTDHDKFARKFYQLYSYSEDKVEGLLPDKTALTYISQKTGASLDQLLADQEDAKKKLKKQIYDLSLKGQNKKNVIDNTTIRILEESPVKKADILLFTHWGSEKFSILLHNCIQTDQGWYLGDFVGLEGETLAAATQKVADEKNAQIAAWLADASRDLSYIPDSHWLCTLLFGETDGKPFYYFTGNPVPEADGVEFPEFTLRKNGNYDGQINYAKGQSKPVTGPWKLEGNQLVLSGKPYDIHHASSDKLILKDPKGIYLSFANHDKLGKNSGAAVSSTNGEKKIKPWIGPDFPMLPGQPYTQYVNKDLIEKPVRGFYIDQTGNKKEAVIKYQEPELLARSTSTLLLYRTAYNEPGFTEDELTNFIRGLMKDSVVAFSVAGQVYVPVQLNNKTWGILRKEGAIRQVVILSKGINEQQYIAGTILDKLEGRKENIASMTLNFKSSMAEMVSDYTELADKVRNKADGYRLAQVDKIVAEYNEWYDKQHPGKVRYLFNEDGSVAWKP